MFLRRLYHIVSDEKLLDIKLDKLTILLFSVTNALLKIIVFLFCSVFGVQRVGVDNNGKEVFHRTLPDSWITWQPTVAFSALNYKVSIYGSTQRIVSVNYLNPLRFSKGNFHLHLS